MAFPVDPLDIYIELKYSGVWNDVTTYGLSRQSIGIRRGLRDEGSSADPSTCSLQLNNVDGRFSPRNPRSPLYGLIGRNTQMRVRVGDRDVSLSLPGVTDSYVSTPDTAALDITGDLDLRIDLEPAAWRNPEAKAFARKFKFSTNELSWSWFLQPDGTVRLWWSPDGSDALRIRANSTVPVPDVGRQAVRVTLDVDNGGGVWEAKFYTATTLGGPWTQLGDTIIGAAVTSLFASDEPVEIGRMGPDGFFDVFPLKGSVYGFEVRNGIDGILVAAPDFSAPEAGDPTLVDSTGLTWTMHGSAAISDRSVRYSGEVSEWPPRWDLSGNDVWVPVTASGIRRRLSQGASQLSSALYRGITGGNITPPVAYWPCEDSSDATSFASALGHEPMGVLGDTSAVRPAAFSGIPASLAIPKVNTGGRFQGNIPEYTPSDYLRSMVLVNIPENGVSSEQTLLRTRTIGGDSEAWLVNILPDGALRLICFAHGGATLVNHIGGFAINGESGLLWIYLVQNGANVDWQVGFGGINAIAIGFIDDTLAGKTFGRAHQVVIGQNFDLNDVAVGHVQVLHTDEFWEILNFARAWRGESARDRVVRLAAEENVPLTIDAGDTVSVGPQRPETFLDLADEAPEADIGFLYDRRDFLALHFQPRVGRYNQVAALAADYTAGEVAPPFEPVEDDQTLRNDIIVNRTGGSSARATQVFGPLSIQAPPDGVGRYDESITINVATDDQLPDQAGWRLHLGTVDESRYPRVTVNLARNPHLIDTVKRLDVGSRLTIANPPDWLPADTIDLIVLGYEETLNSYEWQLTFNCAPGSPWNVAAVDSSRADTAGSELVSAVDSTETALEVATTSGPVWTTKTESFPFAVKVGGEALSVTQVTGAVEDAFARTVTSGWGTARTGQAWTTTGGATSDYSVEGA